MVIFLCKHLTCITRKHQEERAELVEDIKASETEKVELLRNNIRTLNRIAQALEDRPCLRGDQRIGENDGS